KDFCNIIGGPSLITVGFVDKIDNIDFNDDDGNEHRLVFSDESFSSEPKTPDDYPNTELIEVVSLPEEDDIEHQPAAGITLN
ncbi:unnamed protein product, partial [Rotaria sp. Silwood1]